MKRKGKKPLEKELLAEDWCFCCKDGGELLICDYKQCLKAYHCDCVGKDASFMSSKKRWSCDWHICRGCRKASRYHCICCPIAVCNSCADIQEFVHIKEKYGMCTHCLKLSLLIEENTNVDSDGEQVDFNSRDTVEGLFKEYYDLKKSTLDLNSEVLRTAKSRLRMGRNYPSDSDIEDKQLTSDDETIDDSEGERQLQKRKRCKAKQPLNRKKGRSSKMEFDGWASKSLMKFLSLIGKGTSECLSQQEVTKIIDDYIRQHNLHDPKIKKRILCDAPLQSVLGKKVVLKNRIKDLLDAHFCENQEESEEEEDDDETECDLEEDNHKGKEKRKMEAFEEDIHTETKKRKREAPKNKREPSAPQSRFAAIVAENIKLVYLKRSLVNELCKEPESFKDKITGCFVKAKAHPHDIYQRNSHLLLQVTGVKKALNVENTKGMVLLVSEFPREIPIGMLSDGDFSEEECENLRGRVMAGLLEKPTLVELEKKARILHKDITKHWIDKELKLLKNLIDHANEKGWRQELFEYRERRELLQTQSEQNRLLNEIPSVVPDVEEVESDRNECTKADQVELPAPAITFTTPGSLPDAEEVNSDEDGKTNLRESQTSSNVQMSSPNLPDLEEAKSVCDKDKKIDQGELPLPANTVTCPRSSPDHSDVELVEYICDEDNKTKLGESPTPNYTQGSPKSFPDLEVVEFSCDEDNKAAKGESPTPEDTWTSHRSLPEVGKVESVCDEDNKSKLEESPILRKLPVQDDALLQKKFHQSTSEGAHSLRSCSLLEPQPEKSVFSTCASGINDLIELSSDDDLEDQSSRVTVAEANCEDPELPAWHISATGLNKSGTFSLSILREWSKVSPLAKKYKVWKENQTESDAILLADAIKLAFPRG